MKWRFSVEVWNNVNLFIPHHTWFIGFTLPHSAQLNLHANLEAVAGKLWNLCLPLKMLLKPYRQGNSTRLGFLWEIFFNNVIPGSINFLWVSNKYTAKIELFLNSRKNIFQFITLPLILQFRRLALKSPPLGPKWDRWAKKIGCASDPPVCSLLASQPAKL